LFTPAWLRAGGAALRQLFDVGRRPHNTVHRRICVMDFVLFSFLMMVITIAFFVLPSSDEVTMDTPMRDDAATFRRLAVERHKSHDIPAAQLTPAKPNYRNRLQSQQQRQQKLANVSGTFKSYSTHNRSKDV
jgi:hypothetical protein